jgi:hypothetical protein
MTLLGTITRAWRSPERQAPPAPTTDDTFRYEGRAVLMPADSYGDGEFFVLTGTKGHSLVDMIYKHLNPPLEDDELPQLNLQVRITVEFPDDPDFQWAT